MILIYSNIITPRIKYIFKHIFKLRLGVDVNFTSDIDNFKNYDSYKMSYNNDQIDNEFYINTSEILFSSKIEDLEINVENWDGHPVFFFNKDNPFFKFDIFAASFYLISRYEEYLLHLKDDFGRFDPSSSIAYKNRFLNKPIIDFWIERFKSKLLEFYPDFNFKKQSYKLITCLEVPCAFDFKGKGLVRTIGGVVRDFLRLDIYRLYRRIPVLLNIRRDPLDNYSNWIDLNKNNGLETMVFFLIGNFSRYDRNLSFYSKSFTEKIKDISDFCEVSLLSSYSSLKNEKLLEFETNKLQSIVHRSIKKNRQNLLKIDFPLTYRNFARFGFNHDYSLQYYDMPGFRASTTNPFYFFDLENELETKLLIHPVCATDRVLKIYKKPILARQALEEITRYVKEINGEMILVLNNSIISDYSTNYKWKKMFNKFFKSHGKNSRNN